ncbi:sigma factor [Clostridia bacterium]|nr:sigma factor [Clostridia bacterium]
MERHIVINGENIPVTEEVYRAYKRPAWAERKRRKVRAEHERSLELFVNMPSGQKLVEEIVEDKLLLDTLMAALSELTADERKLIDALYYVEKSEREYGKQLDISQNTINYHKNRVLEKLRKFFE